jgi:hypothetical protein
MEVGEGEEKRQREGREEAIRSTEGLKSWRGQ